MYYMCVGLGESKFLGSFRYVKREEALFLYCSVRAIRPTSIALLPKTKPIVTPPSRNKNYCNPACPPPPSLSALPPPL